MLSALALVLALGAVPDDTPSFVIRTSVKASALLSHAPDDPALFPERDSATSFWRLRIEPEKRFSEKVTLGAAYEHRLRFYSQAAGLAGAGILPPDTKAPYRIRQLDWGIWQSSGLSWRHEIDRAYAAFHLERVELTLGRQAIGWGRGVIFGAVDLFSPFTPLEADREWRRGVDALRADVKLTSRMSVDLVGAFGESIDESAFASRLRGYAGEIDLEVMGGRRAGDLFLGVTSSAALGGAEAHGEIAVFRAPESLPSGGLGEEGRIALKAVAGTSYQFPLGNGLLVFLEYHYSGFGAKRPEDILPLLANPQFLVRYLRGDTQILDRHEMALLATYELSPELALNATWLSSLKDGSGLVAPSATLTFGDKLSLLLTAYLPYGRPPEGLTLKSLYGASATSGFVQIRIYL